MTDLASVTNLLGIGASIAIIGGAGYGVYRWWNGTKEAQIVCEECDQVFTPKYHKGKKTRKGLRIEFANCPHCGERNEFEVDDE